ncbi:MAG: MBL fold metallo-hydrolase [Deltaproteobacteria bacterium]|nr:MBL fold metallo-hydrolase [Deltaproteobacteria bacterium]
MNYKIEKIDRLEILTLQDNYIDIVAGDNSKVIQRGMAVKEGKVKNSILAEHGFSALVTVTRGEQSRCMLFDFGFSADGAARNAKALDADLSRVEVFVLSHGHLDHVGGIEALASMVGKKGVDLVLHPWAFTNPRFLKTPQNFNIYFPPFTRETAKAAGVNVIESEGPCPLLDGQALFLGQIPRATTFEKGSPDLCCEVDGEEMPDPFHDDTGVAFHVRGKGLVVLTGCAHAGIVNTVKHAQKVCGIDKAYAVMGGFHLSGTDFDGVISPTTKALKEIDPQYIVPTHCTGREASIHIEKEMPEQFILNMSGTKLTFAA